jgi:site-specific DNA recombinase
LATEGAAHGCRASGRPRSSTTATCGTGILNNELYVGRYVWNRSAGKKRPGSAKRAQFQRPTSEHVVVDAPGLRIVPQELWDKAKARQRRQTERVGIYVRDGLAVAKARGIGRSARYVFSGLLKCAVCGANFTVSGPAQSYVCASHTNGGKHACSNKIRVQRRIVEVRLLESIGRDLLSPESIAAYEQDVRRVLRERRTERASNRDSDDARLKKLQQERANLIEAIATVGLKGNAGLAERLARTEKELMQLESRSASGDADLAKVADVLPRAVERYRKLVADLGNALATRRAANARADDEADRRRVDRAQAALRGLLGGSVRLAPADTGDHLVAELALAPGVVAKSFGYEGNIKLVAGVGFEPTTFGL